MVANVGPFSLASHLISFFFRTVSLLYQKSPSNIQNKTNTCTKLEITPSLSDYERKQPSYLNPKASSLEIEEDLGDKIGEHMGLTVSLKGSNPLLPCYKFVRI